MLGSTAPPTHGSGLPAMASVSAQNRLRQPITSPIWACTPRKASTPVARAAFMSSPAMKSSFTAKPRAALHGEAVDEARARIELLQALDVAMDEHVLPGDEGVVEHEDGVVLVEAAGQRIVPRRSGRGGRQLVGGPADELDAGRVHGCHEHHHHARIVDFLAHVLAEEVVVRQGRVGGDDLGARRRRCRRRSPSGWRCRRPSPARPAWSGRWAD